MVSAARANRPFRYGANDRREFIVTDGEVAFKAVNDSSGNPVYVARAKAGTPVDEEKWQIQRLAYDANDSVVSVTWPENDEGNASTEYEFAYDNVTAVSITGISQANPGVVTMASNPFTDGDVVIIEGVVGMVEVNFANIDTRLYVVANGTGTTFELNDLDGNNVNTSGFTAYTSGGTVRAPNWANYTFA